MARVLTRSRTTTAKKDFTPVAVNDVATAAPAPARGRGRRSSLAPDEAEGHQVKHTVKKGWDAADDAKTDFADDINKELTDEAFLIKFLEDAPFAVIKQHWVTRKGKKSWTCLEDEGCPICDDTGDRPSPKVTFNVVSFADPDKPVNAIWTVASRVSTQLKNMNKDVKTGPLNRDDLYFSVSRTGKDGNSNTTVTPYKERDVKEDWDIDPLTEEEIDTFVENVYDDSIIEYHTAKQLAEIADEMLD